MTSIDLNADLGEGMDSDDAMLAIVSSASIACGGHGGDAGTIRHLLAACKARGIRAGAHPGYRDKANFGRLRLVLPIDQVIAEVRSQMFLIRWIAREVDARLSYVKLHGALANQAAEQLPLAVAIFGTIEAMDPSLAVMAIDNTAQVRAAHAVGARVIREAYADRAYQPNGLLVPRGQPGAVLTDIDAVVARCVRLAAKGEIVAADGTVLTTAARSICLHGDTPGAVDLAIEVRAALEGEGVTIGE